MLPNAPNQAYVRRGYLERSAEMKIPRPIKFGCLLPLAILVTLTAGVAIYDKFAPSAARKALPQSAADIEEYYREAGFLAQDFTRCLKAKIPSDTVAGYANRLRLPHRYTSGQKVESIAGLDSGYGLVPSWFDPPAAVDADEVYYDYGPAWIAVLKYKAPNAYFIVIDW